MEEEVEGVVPVPDFTLKDINGRCSFNLHEATHDQRKSVLLVFLRHLVRHKTLSVSITLKF